MDNLLLTKQVCYRIGTYQRTGSSNNVIGDINADWKAVVLTDAYLKNLNLSFLLDMQKVEMSLLTHGMVYRDTFLCCK
jgi:hypothetical protein